MVSIRACLPRDFAGILEVQREAHRDYSDPETQLREGYVTWRHHLSALKVFNGPVPHTVALDEGQRVVAYALSMDPVHAGVMPEARTFVEEIEHLSWRGQPIADANYVCMGQIALSKAQRGTGLFRQLYQAWFAAEAVRYSLAVTEIAALNVRSMNAHAALGWEEIARRMENGQEWVVVGRQLRD